MNPNAAQIAVVIALVVAGTLILATIGAIILYLFRAIAPNRDAEPSLLEQVQANTPKRGALAKLDRDFDRIVEGTMFGISTDRAVEIVLLAVASAAVGLFIITGNWMIALAVGLVGGLVPVLLFYVFRNRRRAAIQEQLPDGCFQLARCLRAGLTVEAGFSETAAYSNEPLAKVFREGARLMEGGIPTPQAVQHLADDIRLTDFDTMAALLSLQTDVGGNLPMILDRLAAAIRDRNQFRGYYRSVTALSRITAGFVAIAGPLIAIGFWFYQPDLARNFIDMPLGNVLLAAAVVLWFLGVFWILWLLSGRENY